MKLPRGLSGDEAVRAFRRTGWQVFRMTGSHIVLEKEGEEFNLSIPRHDELGHGLLRHQIRLAGLSVEQFVQLLRKNKR
ncbi:MAG: type II toxin-antitoxin system HicA family toxin [Armatimonadia bacterium]